MEEGMRGGKSGLEQAHYRSSRENQSNTESHAELEDSLKVTSSSTTVKSLVVSSVTITITNIIIKLQFTE